VSASNAAAIASVVAAIATVVLAIATVYLGNETRQLARKTNETLEAEQKAELNRRSEVQTVEADALTVTPTDKKTDRAGGPIVQLLVVNFSPKAVFKIKVALTATSGDAKPTPNSWPFLSPRTAVRTSERLFNLSVEDVPVRSKVPSAVIVVRSEGLLRQEIVQTFDLYLDRLADARLGYPLVQTDISVIPSFDRQPAAEPVTFAQAASLPATRDEA
jgi:hypothetical protein